MPRWDDSFLRRPAADLAEAATAREAAAADPAATLTQLAAAGAALADAEEIWADVEDAWQAGLDGGWLDPEPEPEAGG